MQQSMGREELRRKRVVGPDSRDLDRSRIGVAVAQRHGNGRGALVALQQNFILRMHGSAEHAGPVLQRSLKFGAGLGKRRRILRSGHTRFVYAAQVDEGVVRRKTPVLERDYHIVS